MDMLREIVGTFTSSQHECWCVRCAIFGIGLLGSIGMFKLVRCLLYAAWTMVRPSKVTSYGKWAVVTGATDGIGLAYCHEFAANGLNVVLISRTQSKLDDCAAEIKKKNPKVEVKTIQADFDTDCYDGIAAGLQDVPVGILVNNVGRSYPHAEFFDAISDELIDSLVRMNVTSTTRMTRMVLPGMIEREKGAIVNVSSAAGFIPTGNPLYAVYSATKAYVDFLSRSLHLEYAAKGIDVQCQVPYFVTTKLAKIRNASLTVPTPKAFARHAARCIGYGATAVPFPAHAVQDWVLRCMPQALLGPVLVKMHLGIRKAAYRKRDKESSKSK